MLIICLACWACKWMMSTANRSIAHFEGKTILISKKNSLTFIPRVRYRYSIWTQRNHLINIRSRRSPNFNHIPLIQYKNITSSTLHNKFNYSKRSTIVKTRIGRKTMIGRTTRIGRIRQIRQMIKGKLGIIVYIEKMSRIYLIT